MTYVELEFPASDRFEALACLGRGGMGTVYKVFDREARAHVALKLLERKSPEALLRFKSEFRRIQDIQHPNLVSLGELGQLGHSWYFTMELIDGTDVRHYVTATHGPRRYDEKRLRGCLAQLAHGLAALHARGKVHRDIKPSNVLVTPEGRVVLLDFGLMLDLDDPEFLTATNKVVGTTAYMAPEQSRPGSAEAASDLYSVGVVLYQILTGVLPFSGNNVEIVMLKRSTPPRPPSDLDEKIPEDLDRLCHELLAIEPTERPTAVELLARLGETAASSELPRPEVRAPFVGRAAELARLNEALAGGRATLLAIEGPSGIGKSELLARFADRAEGRGAIVLGGRCYEREHVPFKGFDGVVDALAKRLKRFPRDELDALVPEDAGVLSQAFPALRRVGVFRDFARGRGDTRGARERLHRATRGLFTALASRRDVAVTIDDMQWATPDTWSLLEAITAGPGAPAMLVVLASRGARARAARAGATVVELGPLPHADAAELARELAGDETIDTASLAREAGGHPLFLHELARHVRGPGAPPPTLDDVLSARVARLDPAAREILELVAASGAPMPHAVIAAAAGLSSEAYRRAFGELRAAHLIRAEGSRGDRVVHYHNRVGELVAGALDDDARRERHRRLGDALEEEGIAEREPELIVHHLLATEPSRAARYAADAATRAMDALAFDRAAELYRLAVDGGAREHEGELARALIGAGRGAEAADILVGLAERATGVEAIDLRRRAAEHLLVAGDFDRGLEILRDALEPQGIVIPATTSAAFRRSALLYVLERARGVRAPQRGPDTVAPADRVRVDSLWTAAMGLSLVDTARGGYFQLRHFREARSRGDSLQIARALAIEAGFHVLGGASGRGRAERLLRRAEELAADSGDLPSRHRLDLARAFVEQLSGNFAAAEAKFAVAAAAFARDREQEGSERVTWELNAARLYRLIAARCAGYLPTLRERARTIARRVDQPGTRLLSTSVSVAVAPFLDLAEDRPGDARARIEQAIARWSDTGFYLQHVWHLIASTEIDLYAGPAERARSRIEERWSAVRRGQHLRSQLFRIELHGLRARAALAAGGEHRAAAHAHIAAIARERTPWAEALAALLRGVASERTERAAIVDLEAAMAAFEHLRMPLHAAVARYRWASAVGGDVGADARADAHAALVVNGVAAPERYIAALAPTPDEPNQPAG